MALTKDLSWDRVASALSRPGTQKALYSAVIAAILSSAILPTILPSRFSIFGLPPLQDVFSNVFGNRESRRKLKKHGLDKWIESERDYAWKRLLK